MPKQDHIPRSQVIAQIADQLTEPITFNDFADRVLAIAPSAAKNPRSAVRTEIRFNTIEYGLIFMDDRRSWLMPAQVGMRGVRFRHNVSQWEAENGMLVASDDLLPFLAVGRHYFETVLKDGLRLIDDSGSALPFELVRKNFSGKDSIFGHYSTSQNCLDLKNWFRNKKVKAGDSILFTIEQWKPAIWKIEHEPAAQRNQAVIEQYNAELADILFEMLENERDERLYLRYSLPTAVLRVTDPKGYPGDPWTTVIEEDGRMRYSDFDLQYADGQSNFFDILEQAFVEDEEIAEEVSPRSLSVQEANRIYRFKCWLEYNPKLWRKIEILGKQTLAEFSKILVVAFKHDPDHLARFSHLIQRGKSKRYREVEIGTIDPYREEFEEEIEDFFDGIDGNSIRIADLELAEGSLLQFVFDFGDWHEHRLQLEEILPTAQKEQSAECPRIVEQNEPEYQYCEECHKQNKREIATWVCIQCSNRRQEDVLLCENCLDRNHEDHYAEEMLY